MEQQSGVRSILVVDDEERIRGLLRKYLENEGFRVDEVKDGETALKRALENDYHLIVLDVMMQGIDGIEVCTKLRQSKATPVMMLTARGEESYLVKGFQAGADDYVVKPFSPREMTYRVKSIMRRSAATYCARSSVKRNMIVFPQLVIDDDAHRVTASGQEVKLTPMEYELLHYLAMSPDKVLSREELLKDVWKYINISDLRVVDTHIKRLREKLNRVSSQAASMVSTIWGVGYKLDVRR